MIDDVRVGVVLCAFAVFLIGSPQWARWWRTYPPEVLQGRLALAALNLAVGYGTLEALVTGTPGGPRTYVTAVGELWALYTVAWQPAVHVWEWIRETCHRHPESLTTPPPTIRYRPHPRVRSSRR